MKFNPYEWQEITVGKEVEFGKGRLRLRCSQASPLYVSINGQEALAGVETSFDLTFSEAVSFRLDAEQPVRAFVRIEQETAVKPSGETFTNIDRMVEESGTIAEVTKALRLLKLEQRAGLKKLRAEREALKAEQLAAAQAASPEPAAAAAASEAEGADT